MEAVVRGHTKVAVAVLDNLGEALAEARRKIAVLDSLFGLGRA